MRNKPKNSVRRQRRAASKNFKDGKMNQQGIVHMMAHFDKLKPVIEQRIKDKLDSAGIPYNFNLKDESFSVAMGFEEEQQRLENIVKSTGSEVVDELIKFKGDYRKVK